MTVLAFIGSAGVPNRYGGFESFLDACAPIMAEMDTIIVTCDASHYPDREGDYHGIERVFVSVPANGAASILHDIVAFAKVVWRADAIIVLGVSAGLAFPVMRAMCGVLGKRLIVNVDGLEWRRTKFGKGKRAFLKISDFIAQLFAHRVIVDNAALTPFVAGRARAKLTCIPYSGDQVPRLDPKAERDGMLTICRIESENNCHLLLEAAAQSSRIYRFVGNWNASEYGRQLRQRYEEYPNLSLIDPVYEENLVARMRESCLVYLHGHSVGGTNPSLVEMLFYDCHILAFDCAFNRETAGDAATYFTDHGELSRLIQALPPIDMISRKQRRTLFTRAKIVDAYRAVAGQT